MNRRDFLKIIPSFLGSAYLLPYWKGKTMSTNSQVFERFLSGDTLLESEKQQLVRAMNDHDETTAALREFMQMGTRQLKRDFPFEVLYSEVLPVDTASLEFAIPANYKHLMIMGQGRATDAAAISNPILIQFNNDTGANYSYQRVSGVQAAATAAWDIASSYMRIDDFAADSAAAGENGAFVLYIPHYNSTFYKTLFETGSIFVSPTGSGVSSWAGRWLNTDKITSIKIYADTTTFANAKIQAGSLISIYGIT